MDPKHLALDYATMIKIDQQHLVTAVDRGDRTEAHRCVDSIIDTERLLEDLIKAHPELVHASAQRVIR